MTQKWHIFGGVSGLDGASINGAGGRDGNWGSVSDQYGNVVYFEFDSSDIQPASEEMLNAYSKLLKSSGAHATLEGNTDERGTREYNMALGERRGKSVAESYFIYTLPNIEKQEKHQQPDIICNYL